MLLQLFSQLTSASAVQRPEPKENLRSLILNVNEELARAEDLFNLAEDDALLDTAIYQLKALTAYQQFLLCAIRENELDAESFLTEAVAAADTQPCPENTGELRASAPSC